MTQKRQEVRYDLLDSETYAIYLNVPGSQIVVLQAFFELYEGVAITRTLSVKNSLVCLLTVPDMYPDCVAILNAIHNIVPWRMAEPPDQQTRALYHGYAKKGKEL